MGLHLTMLQIYLYQYLTAAETHKEREIDSMTMYGVQFTYVDLIIIINTLLLFIYFKLNSWLLWVGLFLIEIAESLNQFRYLAFGYCKDKGWILDMLQTLNISIQNCYLNATYLRIEFHSCKV